MCDNQLIWSPNDDLSNAPAWAFRPRAPQGRGRCAGVRRAGRGWLQLLGLVQLVLVIQQQFLCFSFRVILGQGVRSG